MLKVGIDVGGTFTDIVILDEETQNIRILKVLTNPRRPVESIIRGLESTGIDFSKVRCIVHATTLGTNIFFGQEGLRLPKTALITTRGFRDAIEIGRQRRPSMYNLFFDKPRPLIPRKWRFEVTERVGPDGKVLTPLNVEEVMKIAEQICREKFEVVVVSYLHSYVNPEHEVKTAEIVKKICPEVEVVTSHEVCPEVGEYERTSTTILNALLRPVLSRYLSQLQEELKVRNFTGKLLIMQSSGGVVEIDYAVKLPAAFIESGPAAGVIACTWYASMLGHTHVISFDMGGTTAKTATIVNFEPIVTMEYEVCGQVHMGRIVRGFGYPVKMPFIDLVEVSAGGGTVAWIDEGGALRVGPMSVGADPGPACYGRGGNKPTITDAHVVLGRLGLNLAGGQIRLNPELARKVIGELADKLSLSIEETAYMIVKLSNVHMGKALRIVTIERGLNPEEFTLYAYGGCGPLHACELAEEFGIRQVVVPVNAGVFSAYGLLFVDYRLDRTIPILKVVDEVNEQEIMRRVEEVVRDCVREVKLWGSEDVKVIVNIEVRYRGQLQPLTLPLITPFSKLVEEFECKYRQLYGYDLHGEQIELVNVRITVIGTLPKPRLKAEDEVPHEPQPDELRDVYDGSQWVKARVYRREKLRSGATFSGPAVVEEDTCTIYIPERFTACVDKFRNIVITREV